MPFVLGIHGSVFDSFVALDSHLASASDGVGDLRGQSTSHSKWHTLHPKGSFLPYSHGVQGCVLQREVLQRQALCLGYCKGPLFQLSGAYAHQPFIAAMRKYKINHLKGGSIYLDAWLQKVQSMAT